MKRIEAHAEVLLEDQMIFYNSWLYAGIHILCAIPRFQSQSSLCKKLSLSVAELEPIVQFLIKTGMLESDGDQLKQGQARVHLAKDSPFLGKHHLNWRMKALRSLDRNREKDLHYSMVMSLSRSDIAKVKEIILESITRTDKLLKATGDEVAYGFCIDLFEL